jgi:hypothetical protein
MANWCHQQKEDMSQIHQLNPPLEMSTPKGKGLCYLYIDYGLDNEVWLIADDKTGEAWFYKTSEIKFRSNITMGRVVMTNKTPKGIVEMEEAMKND